MCASRVDDWQAYWQFQRQLWDDVEDVDDPRRIVSRLAPFASCWASLLPLLLPLLQGANEGSYHAWGRFGLMIVDGRGCRSFGRVAGDEFPPFRWAAAPLTFHGAAMQRTSVRSSLRISGMR